MAEENPHIRFHQVPGNCDRFRCDSGLPDFLCYNIGNVRFYMTHGHKHGVKSDIFRLLEDAYKYSASAVLFGHTHQAQCFQNTDGLWVLNPGSCQAYSGSVGVIEIRDNIIIACRIMRQAELDEIR